ncbi:hypothetical protein FHX74_000396 [Friedmanniella endophytica]|uniref:Phosphodiester glycosidase domain-containing protein n=1 Tax=Microlunatus kandeliicorticis TaxID=1759536 RepID=A0A7W3IPE6_9ACTN|nr:hypothetical protein [Microlunatus kandeliicorticis]MBA8792802.1 hypothetical protein [Microlunatus kandeliicorticis]
MTPPAVPVPRRTRPRRSRAIRSGTPGRRRVLAGVLAAALVLLAFPGVSLGRALAAPTSDPLGAKAAEWARDHGLGFAVTAAEQVVYWLHPPKTGGTPDPSLLQPPAGSADGGSDTTAPGRDATGSTGRHHAVAWALPHAPLTTVATPALPGEGVFRTVVRVDGHPAVQVAYLRPDPVHTSYLAAVTVFDPRLVRFVQHPGATEPGHLGLFRQPDWLPPSERSGLLATFNNGFKLADAHGGYQADHHTVVPLRTGAASLVVDVSGRIDVGSWGTEVGPGPQVAAVRQNLQLLVDHGRVCADVASNDPAVWGLTIAGADYVWRSGIGVDAHGTVIEVSGPSLSAPSLARLLQRAGAVRAMELDINPAWVSTMWYSGSGSTPHKVLPFSRPADRYFTPSTRDFVAVYAR